SASRVVGVRLGDQRDLLRGATAELGDELGRVAREVPLQHLEDAARMLQRLVFGRRLPLREGRGWGAVPDGVALELLAPAGGGLHRHALVLPALGVVAPRPVVPAGEGAARALRVREGLAPDRG